MTTSTSILLSCGELIVARSETHLAHAGQMEFLDQELIASYEAPERVALVLQGLRDAGLIAAEHPRTRVVDLTVAHDPAYVADLEAICAEMAGTSEVLLPMTWPGAEVRHDAAHPPRVRLGRWSRDTFTSVGGGTFQAAAASVACAVAAQDELLARGHGAAFALGRPPHHHAGPAYMNGYCYLNGAATAALRARARGLRVAVVDIDYHHGNGTQDILYGTDILYASIHGDPGMAFPYFHGFADERGVGRGEGLNFNVPLPAGADWWAYRDAIGHVLSKVGEHGVDLLIVSLGVDTYRGDPVGRFLLDTDHFLFLGEVLRVPATPTLFVMEGGYAVEAIGRNVANVLAGHLG